MSERGEVVIPEPLFTPLQGHLLHSRKEEVALLFAHQAATPTVDRLIVSRWEAVPDDALLVQGDNRFALDGGYLVQRVKPARTNHESVLLAHSHPGDEGVPCFSLADAKGERDLYAFLGARLPGRAHGALVVSPGGVAGRLARSHNDLLPARVRLVGRRISFHPSEVAPGSVDADPSRARQELLWGARGQTRLCQATVGLIGAGGTGSVTAQQLIHLGVGTLIVVDPELAAESNLGRIVGMRRSDIDRTPKVEIVARTARQVDPGIDVRARHQTVCRADVLRELREADLLFSCTDGHWSRAVVNALAVQYRIPLVDTGFSITMNTAGTRVASAVGEVRVVVPGGYCLSCAGVLDPDRILAEQVPPAERATFPRYFANLDVEDPSVITLNSVVASLAVSIGLDMLVPCMTAANPFDGYQYNALKGLVRHTVKNSHPGCGVCGPEGIGGFGDDLSLPCA